MVALVVAVVPASAGGSDAGFGNGGWLKVGGGYVEESGLAVRPDGRLVVLLQDGWLEQRLSDGRIDHGFRAHSIAGADPGCCAEAFLVLQPDGKLLTAADGLVARYTAIGALDTSFGSGGHVTLTRVAGIAVSKDGRIVVGVTNADGTVGKLRMFLADGRPDTRFGEAGVVALPAGVVPRAVAVDPAGGIVVAGSGRAVAKYRDDGSLDGSFTAGIGAGENRVEGWALALQPDGKVVVASVQYPGLGGGGGGETDLVRLLPDGRLDPTFGSGGIVPLLKIAQSIALPAALALLPDGAVAVAGAIYPTCSCKGAGWLTLRVSPDGGISSVQAPGDADPDHDCWGGVASAVGVQPDGKILFGGDMCDNGGSSTYVGRFTPSLALDAGPPLRATLTGVHVRSGPGRIRLTGTLKFSDAATVVVTVGPRDGRRVPLLAGSRLGGASIRNGRSLHASFTNAGEMPLALVFTTRPRTSYLVRVSLADDRSRTAEIRLRVPVG